MRKLIRSGAVVLLLTMALYGQNITGSIAGQVVDSGGAVVPNAKVTATNTDTKIDVRTVTADKNGRYSLPLLPIGHYQLTVDAPGFKRFELKNIELNVNDNLAEDAHLQVGATQETVSVSADQQEIQTENATASSLISGTQIRELSINNRNYEQLVNLMPGVSYGAGDQLFIGLANPSGQTNVVSFSINGQRNSANNWTVDGADNVDRGSNLTLLNYPSVDAISEFKVLRGLYSPEFGRAGAGQINVATKSGTDQFHGNAYEFFRNDKLNANNYFNNLNKIKRPPLRYNNFGYTIGGPIFKNKTFFFFSEEFHRIITYGTASGLAPTAAQLAGTFVDPVCLDVRPAGSTSGCTTTGTQVTTINPVAAAYIQQIWSKVPAPQSGNTLVEPLRNVFNHRQELVRIDHTFSPRLSIFGRYIQDAIPTVEPGGLFTGDPLPGVATTQTNSPGRNIMAHATFAFSPTLLFDGGYAFSYGAITSNVTGLMSSKISQIPVTLPFASTLTRVPSVSIAGASSLTSFGPYRDFNRDHNVFANVTKVIGSHTLRFGESYHHYQKTENNGGPNAGSFSFTSTGKPAGPTTTFEQSWANFLLGNVATFSQASLDITPDIHMQQWEAFGQDEWRVRNNLSITYGVRYSFFGAPIDVKKELTNFDPATYLASAAPQISSTGLLVANTGNPLNGIIVNGAGSPYGSHVSTQNYANFAPRIGIAWDPWGDGKTSIRTGYGMFYDSGLVGTFEQNIFANPPFVNSISISNTRFENPTAGTPNVNLAPKTLHGTVVNNHTPYTQQWSLDMQHQITPSTIFDIGYYGAKDSHLLGIIDINQPQPGAYIAAGLTTGGAFITSATTQKLNLIRPYLGYGPINAVEPIFSGNYNSLQMSLQKRFSGQSLVSVNYTWSKALTNAQTDRSTAPQDSYDIAAEYGRSQLDRRQIFNANAVYELPWLRQQQGILGHTLGGWEFSGILAANTGLPLTIFSGLNADPAGLGCIGPSACSNRPDMVGNPSGPQTLTQWFNTSAFAPVPAGNYRPGNSGRGVVSGPGFWRTDISMFKNFKITERVNMQFRTESFNTLNHTNFDAVGTTLGFGSFGKVLTARDPRNLQFGLKIGF